MRTENQRWWLTEDQVTAVISADPETLYDVVSDLPRVGEWSPECEAVDWVDDTTTPVAGTRFVGHNAVGPGRRIRYSRRGRVLTAERGREFAFVTEEGGREGTIWRYRFEPHPDGTRVTESYTVEWIPLWARILDVPLNRHRELVENMRTTLENLAATAVNRAESETHHRSDDQKEQRS